MASKDTQMGGLNDVNLGWVPSGALPLYKCSTLSLGTWQIEDICEQYFIKYIFSCKEEWRYL